MATVPADHVIQEVANLRQSYQNVAVDIRDLASAQAAVRAEVRLAWKIGLVLAAFVLPSLLGLAWQAGALSTEVRVNAMQLEKRMDRLETAVDQRFNQIMQRLAQVVAKPGLKQ
jgi:hypothetical protein